MATLDHFGLKFTTNQMNNEPISSKWDKNSYSKQAKQEQQQMSLRRENETKSVIAGKWNEQTVSPMNILD